MFKVEIKHSDNSPYWVEKFYSEASANSWLSEEQTRPYWQDDFIVEVTETYPASIQELDMTTVEARKSEVSEEIDSLEELIQAVYQIIEDER